MRYKHNLICHIYFNIAAYVFCFVYIQQVIRIQTIPEKEPSMYNAKGKHEGFLM